MQPSHRRGSKDNKTKEGSLQGEVFQMWQDGPLCILVSFEEK